MQHQCNDVLERDIFLKYADRLEEYQVFVDQAVQDVDLIAVPYFARASCSLDKFTEIRIECLDNLLL